MKKLQKLVSMLLVLCIFLSMMPVTALATEITDIGLGGASPNGTLPADIKIPGANATVIRLSGKDRFQTSFAVAEELKLRLGVDKFESIIVANGANFPDALSGSYLAAVKTAPILLSGNENTNDMTVDYIRENLKPSGTVYLLGGKNAVSETFESALREFRVKRLAGKSRFETNLAILEEAGVGNKPILICTGMSFADSLSASATEFPILLVQGDELLPSQTAFLNALDGNDLFVIGGTSAVSETMAQKLAVYGNVDRVAGKTRFETSIAIAERFFPTLDNIVLAYGGNFPDGLCGASLAAAVGAPLVLTMEGREADAAAYAAEQMPSEGYVLGGKKLIPDQSVALIFGNQPSDGRIPGETVPEEEMPEIKEKAFLPYRSADFTFLVSCDWGEEYVRRNLQLTGENGAVPFRVTAEEDGVYRIAATEPYQQYQTYLVQGAEDMLFPEYKAKALEFSIVGPDRAEIVFNEDNLIFLKNLELQQYGASGKYELRWDESAQRYYLTLFELEAVADSMIGKVFCIGDYSSTDEILADGTRELCFAKLENIGRNAEGQLLLELSAPQVSEVYDELDIYFASGAGEMEVIGDPEMVFADAIVNSDGFAEYLVAAHLAAESFAEEYGLVAVPLAEASDDNLEFELTEHSLESIPGSNACLLKLGGEITYTIPLNSKAGQPEGSITLSCNATISSTISAAGEYKDDESVNLCLTNTTTTTLGFGMEFKMEYSNADEPKFGKNKNTGKIHTETCRIATKSTNPENIEWMALEELGDWEDPDNLEKLRGNECKVCKPITGFDGTGYVFSEDKEGKKVHCVNCDHVGKIKELHTVYPATTNGYTPCKDCKPEERKIADFDNRMLNAIKGSDWEKQVTAFKDMLGDSIGSEKPPAIDPKLSVPINVFGVFNIVIGVKPVIEFDIKASANFTITTSTTNIYGIHNVGEEYETYHDEQPGEVEDTYKLSFTGEAEAKFGIELFARANPVGLEKVAYIEINGQVGLYGLFTGIFAVEGVVGENNTDVYCAARLEVGLYAGLGGSWKILWFNGTFEIMEEKHYPLVEWGYDRTYYAFEDETTEWTVNGPEQVVILNLADLLYAKYIDMPSMEYDTGFIHPKGIGKEHFNIQVDIENMDGTPCDFLEYIEDTGKVIRKLDTPEYFDAVITVHLTPKVELNTLAFFFENKRDIADSVYGCDTGALVVNVSVGEKDPEHFQDRILGVYMGSYFATQGETGLTLTVYREGEENKAVFEFYSLPGRYNAKSGKYYMDVTYNIYTDEYIFTATEWIDKPTSYDFVHLKGKLVGEILSGEATYNGIYSGYGSQSFSVTRVYEDT